MVGKTSMEVVKIPPILDPCCGGRMMYFDKQNPCVQYCDLRQEKHVLCDGRVFEITPDTVADFRALPFLNETFYLVVFDPPHIVRAGKNSWMRKKYGTLQKNTWQSDLSAGFEECWRVLKQGGTLIFKWNETQIKIKDVLFCFSQKPVFGHTTTQNLKTHWLVFYKGEKCQKN